MRRTDKCFSVGGTDEGWRGAYGWSNKPRPWRGQCRAGSSNTGGFPKPRKRAPCKKNRFPAPKEIRNYFAIQSLNVVRSQRFTPTTLLSNTMCSYAYIHFPLDKANFYARREVIGIWTVEKQEIDRIGARLKIIVAGHIICTINAYWANVVLEQKGQAFKGVTVRSVCVCEGCNNYNYQLVNDGLSRMRVCLSWDCQSYLENMSMCRRIHYYSIVWIDAFDKDLGIVCLIGLLIEVRVSIWRNNYTYFSRRRYLMLSIKIWASQL